jgi:uncharacterized protein involved in exopolysaccharide biosynthesis
MESGRLWTSIARHWLLTSFVLLLVLAAAVAAAYLPKRSYEATAVFGVVPVSTADSTATGPTQLAQALIGNYLAEIASKTTEARVRADFTGPEATTNWSATGENEPGTLVLRVHVTSQDPAVVANVANAYSRLVRTAAPLPQGISFSIIDEARTPTSPIAPNRPLILGAGGILALVLASCAALLAGNKPKRPRSQKPPRTTAAAPAVVPQNLSAPVENERTAEPIRG